MGNLNQVQTEVKTDTKVLDVEHEFIAKVSDSSTWFHEKNNWGKLFNFSTLVMVFLTFGQFFERANFTDVRIFQSWSWF